MNFLEARRIQDEAWEKQLVEHRQKIRVQLEAADRNPDKPVQPHMHWYDGLTIDQKVNGSRPKRSTVGIYYTNAPKSPIWWIETGELMIGSRKMWKIGKNPFPSNAEALDWQLVDGAQAKWLQKKQVGRSRGIMAIIFSWLFGWG